MLLDLAYPLALSLLMIFGEHIHIKFKKKRILENKLFSFASGVLITFLFINLLPDLFLETNAWFMYIYVMIGFTTFLLIHELLYKYQPDKKKLKFELKEAHTLVGFIFHFIIGIIMMELLNGKGMIENLIIFIPMGLHVTFSSLASHHIAFTKNYKSSSFDKILEILVVISPLLGAFFALLLDITAAMTYALYGVVGGIMLFIVIREFIPKPKEAQPIFFIAGQFFFFMFGLLRFIK